MATGGKGAAALRAIKAAAWTGEAAAGATSATARAASPTAGAASATAGAALASCRAREVFRIMGVLVSPGVWLVVFGGRGVVLCDVKFDALGAEGLAASTIRVQLVGGGAKPAGHGLRSAL
jgi:hypothetical protein